MSSIPKPFQWRAWHVLLAASLLAVAVVPPEVRSFVSPNGERPLGLLAVVVVAAVRSESAWAVSSCSQIVRSAVLRPDRGGPAMSTPLTDMSSPRCLLWKSTPKSP